MAASFFAPGSLALFIQQRGPNQVWKYLGTSVLAPEIDAKIVSTPFVSDLLGPLPIQLIFNGEFHQITATINRLNFDTWRILRNQGIGSAKDRELFTYPELEYAVGQPIINNLDFRLLIVAEAVTLSPETTPEGAAKNRLYYSCMLDNYHETTINNRVVEVTMSMVCYPLLHISKSGSPSENPDPNKKILPTDIKFLLYLDDYVPSSTLVFE